jgi:hypothetical protein
VSSSHEPKRDAPSSDAGVEDDEAVAPAVDGSGARDMRSRETRETPEPPRPTLTAVPIEPPTTVPAKPAPRAPSGGAKKPKREIPPYLRVIK